MADIDVEIYRIVPEDGACDICEALSGYVMGGKPELPIHDGCRCTLETIDPANANCEVQYRVFTVNVSEEAGAATEFHDSNGYQYKGSGDRSDKDNWEPAEEDSTRTYISDEVDLDEKDFSDDEFEAYALGLHPAPSSREDTVEFTTPAGYWSNIEITEYFYVASFEAEKWVLCNLEGEYHQVHLGNVTGEHKKFLELRLTRSMTTPTHYHLNE